MQTVTLPVIKLVSGEYWVPIGSLGTKVIFRAQAIRMYKGRVADPSGHRMDQAEAEGSVKFRPKLWDISQLQL